MICIEFEGRWGGAWPGETGQVPLQRPTAEGLVHLLGASGGGAFDAALYVAGRGNRSEHFLINS